MVDPSNDTTGSNKWSQAIKKCDDYLQGVTAAIAELRESLVVGQQECGDYDFEETIDWGQMVRHELQELELYGSDECKDLVDYMYRFKDDVEFEAPEGGSPINDVTMEAMRRADLIRAQHGTGAKPEEQASVTEWAWPLKREEYQRYGRQMILPQIGLQGQLRLKSAKVLVVGAGGLGCPAAAYLAGAGVGRMCILDDDTVELSNLHRQILHGTDTIGLTKVDSAMGRLATINPLVHYVAEQKNITPLNAVNIIADYDIVLDCTDRPTTRYLISDACIIAGKPLVSASALRTDGQLTVYNYPAAPPGDESGGPCYRCVWPKPPPAENVLSCGEGGILGPVVGVMGTLMANETMKMIASGGLKKPDAPVEDNSPRRPTMLIFSANPRRPFHVIGLPGRRADCAACSAKATVTATSLTSGSLDYAAFCGLRTPVRILPRGQRFTATEYAQKTNGRHGQDLVDVREKVQYDLCHMPGSVNMPWSQMQGWKTQEDVDQSLKAILDRPQNNLTFVCREGNDSQLAVQKLRQLSFEGGDSTTGPFKDIIGGWQSWRKDVDPDWPDY